MTHDDDAPVGRILDRREALRLLGVGGAAVFAACAKGTSNAIKSTASPSPLATALPGCVARPEKTEGPYFVDEKLNRSDIRSDPGDGTVSAGLPLQLAFSVARISGSACTAFAGALVDVWHCDALGVYSDVSDPGFQTKGKKFLRGYQVTDANGLARFTTIYPGWYQGRTVHIHFKIRSDAGAATGLEFTSQLFFDDAVTDQVHATGTIRPEGPANAQERRGWHLR